MTFKDLLVSPIRNVMSSFKRKADDKPILRNSADPWWKAKQESGKENQKIKQEKERRGRLPRLERERERDEVSIKDWSNGLRTRELKNGTDEHRKAFVEKWGVEPRTPEFDFTDGFNANDNAQLFYPKDFEEFKNKLKQKNTSGQKVNDEASSASGATYSGDPKGGKSGPLQMQRKPEPRPVQDQIPESQFTDAKLPPVTYTPQTTNQEGMKHPSPTWPEMTQQGQQPNPTQQRQQGNSQGAEWIEDPDHKLSPSEVSDKLGGKQGFKTDKGWSIHDPSKEPEQTKPEVDTTQSTSGESESSIPTPAEPEKEKKEKEEPIDLATAQPDAIQKAEAKIYEFHKPPTEEEKAKIKEEVNNQVNDFIQAVLSGKANEATLPEMNKDEKIAFFTALFMAERASMVSKIKITGRNKQKVAWAKELQSKIVTDLNNKANEYINGATKSIAERKEKPKVFGGSLNEFMRTDTQSPEGSPEAYINERSEIEEDVHNVKYNRREYAQGLDDKGLTDTQIQAGGNVRNSILSGLADPSEKLENTSLDEDLKTIKSGGSDALKVVKNVVMAVGQKPPSPNSKDSMVVSFPLTANTEEIKQALSKIVKSLDKKNLGSLIEVPNSIGIALNSDNIRIKATNWQDLQEVFKIVEKETAKIGGAKAKIEDNRYGLSEGEIVETLADMKSQMVKNNGTFKPYGEGEEVQAGEDNKLSKFALAAKTLNCKIVDNGDGTFGLQSIDDGNSSAYNNGVTPDDSDETALGKIKAADEKDKQVPPPITEDPNADLRKYMPEIDKRTREYRNKGRPPKPVPPPKVKPVKPVPPPPPTPDKSGELDLDGTNPAPTAPIPTTPGTISYRPSVRAPAELDGAIDSISDWNDPASITTLNNTIADFNASLDSAVANYDDFAVRELKEFEEKLQKVIAEKTNPSNSPSTRPNSYRIKDYYSIPQFKNRANLEGKGIVGLFRVEGVSKDKIPKIEMLVSMKSKGKGEDRINKKFNKVDDGIWIDGKNGEFFSGWYEVEDLDGQSTIFISEDNNVMFSVKNDEDYKARSFIRRNPYLGGINSKPTISNMEAFYKKDDFLGDRVPITHLPSTQNIGEMSIKYPSVKSDHPDGRQVLTALLGFKHKLINMMTSDERKTAIQKGFHQAINELMRNPSITKLKTSLMDSIDPATNTPVLNDDQKNLLTTVNDDDFMKLLSSVQVERGVEKNAEMQAKVKPDKFRQLISKNIEKYSKETGEPTDLLEYLEARPKGLFRMPEKSDKYYREIMDLPAKIRRRIVNMDGGLPIDEIVSAYGGGNQLGQNVNERYQGSLGIENFLQDLESQYTKFFDYSSESAQAESQYYDEKVKKQTKQAETMMKSPRKVKRDDIQNNNLYKIGGTVYVAVNDPDNEHGWTFISVDGKKTEQELFGDNPEIEVDGMIPKSSEAWPIIGDTLQSKIDEVTPKVSQEHTDGGYSEQDQNPEDYDPFNIHSSVKPRRFLNKERNLKRWL